MTHGADHDSGASHGSPPCGIALSDQLAVVNEATKACTRCSEVKPFSDYYKDARKRDGHQGMCKPCFLAGVKKYRESNKAAIAEKKRRDEKTEAGRARMERYRRSAKAKAKARAAEKARREILSDDYVKRCLLGKNRAVSATELPAELVEMKRLQMATRRLARQLKESTHESSQDPC